MNQTGPSLSGVHTPFPDIASSISTSLIENHLSPAHGSDRRSRRRSVSSSSSSFCGTRFSPICRILLRLCRRPVGLVAVVAMIKSGLDNLRAFVVARPPLVLFLIFLTSVAATLLCLTAYLANNDIRDPSVDYDWNLFLENFAKIDFCVESQRNGTVFPSFNVTVSPSTVENDHVAKNVSAIGIRNFSINVLLVIHPTFEFLARSNNLTHLSGSISGIHLGLSDQPASQAALEVSFELGSNRTLKESLCSKKNFLMGHHCPDVIIPTCAHVSGSSLLFPPTPLAPSTCVASTPSSTPGLNGGTPIETHAKIHAHHEIASYGWGAAPYCPRGPIAHTKFKLDPALTVFLGVDDRSVINLHLLHTSFFLVIMVFSVLCVAACKSHSKLSNTVNNSRPSSSLKSAVSSGNDQRGNYSLVA